MPKAKGGFTWLPKPEEHDYAAARSYLGLIFEDTTSARYARQLARACPAATSIR